MRIPGDRYVLVAATVIAAVLVISAAAVAGVSPLRSSSATTEQSAANVTVTPNGTNESVVRHEDPEDVSESNANLNRVGLELAQSLGIRLNVSAQALVEQNFSAAEAQLGSEYRGDVVRLTEIAEATENASDDEIAAAYRAAGQSQRAVIDDAERFRELYTEYQQARLSQNETKARQAARRLAAEFQDLNATAANLTAAYASLESVNESQAELAQRKIKQSLRQAKQLTENAQEATYEETNLSVMARQPYGSPTRPFVLQGRLRTADGVPLANRTIEVGTALHTTTVQTNRTGHFTIEHRPTLLSSGQQNVSVRYVPNETSGYLGGTAKAAVVITQQSATIQIDALPQTITSAAPGRLTGRVRVGTHGAPGVPVTVIADGKRLGTTRTNANGAFTLRITPDVTTAPGPLDAVIRVNTTAQAVGPTRRPVTLTVGEVPTQLSVEASRVQPRTIHVTGLLETGPSQPLVGRTVTVTIANRTIGWLRTDSNGRFAGNFTLQQDQFSDGTLSADVAVTASFSGGSMHLQATQDTATVTLPAFAPEGLFGYGISPTAWAFLAGALLVLGGGVVLTRRRASADPDEPATAGGDTLTDSNPAVSTTDTDAFDPDAALSSARAVATEDPQAAARRGYIAVRAKLAAQLDITDHDSMTHWEFYKSYHERAPESAAETTALRDLTELYEQAVYANQTPSDDPLAEVLALFAEDADN